MAKKQKTVDLKPQKITDEQLEKIQAIISNINQFNSEIGRIEGQKHDLLHQRQVSQDGLKAVQNELQQQYGTINVNIQDGSIKYPEDEQADKKN